MHAIKQNNAVDIYEDYFPGGEVGMDSAEPPSAKVTTVFRDPQELKRSINALSWYVALVVVSCAARLTTRDCSGILIRQLALLVPILFLTFKRLQKGCQLTLTSGISSDLLHLNLLSRLRHHWCPSSM